MNIGTERNHLLAYKRGEEARHWLLGDEWYAMLTLRGKHRGTVVKGWWKLGPSSITDYFEIGLALGGENRMVQAGVVLPWLGRAHLGVRVPRVLCGWIYDRREWTLRLGYVGRWVELLVASDEHMRDTGMDSYYRRQIAAGTYDGPWSRVALWPGWHLTFSPCLRDRLLGRVKCETTRGEAVPVVVPMPEGNYPGRAYREHRVWQRARWPFSRRERTEWWVDMDVAPPTPGKGENSYDCDDDGIYGTGGPTQAEAVANVTKAALRQREKYGSKDWVPSAGWPAGVL